MPLRFLDLSGEVEETALSSGFSDLHASLYLGAHPFPDGHWLLPSSTDLKLMNSRLQASSAETTSFSEIGGARQSETRTLRGPWLSASFRAFYHEHFALVWRALMRLGVPEDRIEDAVQDVFFVVYRRRADFRGDSSVKTWLYGISVKVAKDQRRAAARHARRVIGLKQHMGSLDEPVPSPAVHTEQREAARMTQAILRRMAPEEREVLVLVELEQLSVAEAAKALELRVRTCQRRLRAARLNFEVQMDHMLRSPADPATPSREARNE